MLYDVLLSDDGGESFDQGKRKDQEKVKKERERKKEIKIVREREREMGRTKDVAFERCIIACECQ